MSIALIIVAGVVCAIAGRLPVTWRSPFLLAFTLVGLLTLQTAPRIFILGSLGLVGVVWLRVQTRAAWQIYLLSLGAGLVTFWLSTTPGQAILNALLIIALTIGLSVWVRHQQGGPISLAMVAALMGILVWFKTPLLITFTTEFMSLSRLEWVGLSYITLRLIGVLLEFRAGRLPPLGLMEFIVYALFPVTLLAGPIDRAERFAADLHAPPLDFHEIGLDGGKRILIGMLKKFVLADTLALAALSPQIAGDVDSLGGAWLAAYLYALRLFFDFSGYSDVAIGCAKLAGICLPENFNAPYLRPNLALFWQNWHMSLTGWFRSYVFMPFSRALLRRNHHLPVNGLAQIITMALIALWHGVTLNFIIWGMWHAAGLIVHKFWVDHTRAWGRKQTPWIRRLSDGLGMLLTFHYVVVGWVFFVLPDTAMSLDYLRKMFGL